MVRPEFVMETSGTVDGGVCPHLPFRILGRRPDRHRPMHESELQKPRDTYVSFIALSLAVTLSGCGSDTTQGNTMPFGGAGTGGAVAPGSGGAAALGNGGMQAAGGSNPGGSASG